LNPVDLQAMVPDDFAMTPEDHARAILNILEDFAEDKARMEQTQHAVFNILADFSDEKDRLEETQSATLNLLEDFDAERCKAESVSHELRASSELLRVAKDAAEASNRELEAFSYSVSHDLRAPLRHLDGFLTLLFKRSYALLDEPAKHYVDATREASQRLGRLIDELLQFSRLGRREIHRMPVNLNDMVEEVRKELEPESRNRTISWQVDPLPIVAADQGMLRQVIENLLGNALKFTSHCPVAVIAVGSQNESTDEHVIFVRDNGAGFDMRYRDKLFKVFQRLHGEDEFEGTGIGLANVRRMVERHGGRVWAQGVVGSGATFYFSLPSGNGENGESSEVVETHLIG
jgi:light-regulated signal transduction histidine kinase (bacteriophytochrome)